jgi:hypothetical protein
MAPAVLARSLLKPDPEQGRTADMKLNGKLVVAVAMMVGSLGAVGCKSQSNEPVAPEEDVASSPTDESAVTNDLSVTVGFENDSVRTRYYAPYAPPAARYEVQTRSPGAGYTWYGGYHRWNGRAYVWYPGNWYANRAGYRYYAPTWRTYRSRYEYIPGHWRRY